MFLVRHLIAVCLGIAARVMYIRWIAVEERIRRIIQTDHIARRPVFDLDAQKPFCNLGQILDGAEPTADDAAHTGPGRVLAVGPSAERGRLSQPRPHLPSADVETPGAFQRWKFGIELASQGEFLSRERRQTDGLDQFVLLITQDAKEVHHFAVKIVVRFDRGRRAVQQDGRGPAKRLAVMMALR